MTAPGHKPRHRHEEWEYSGWAFASPDNSGRRIREKLLQRTLDERKLRRSQQARDDESPGLSLADSYREQHPEIDLRTS
ncbi:MAG: hypothetical protein KDB26_14585 [Microthrixaceae bacterium]|nr:hypothetical protein [Microthrixaceae bacterium]